MKRRNTQSRGWFSLQHLLWGALWAYYYHAVCFRCIPGLSLAQSRLAYWGLLVGLGLLGLCLTFRRQRNNLSLFINLTCPIALYFMLSYWDIHRRAMGIALGITAFLLLSYAAVVVRNWLRDRRNGEKPVRWQYCLRSILRCGRTMAGLALSVGVTVFVVHVAFGGSVVASQSAALSPGAEPVTIGDNIETVCLLEEDRWAQLDAEEKLSVLQTVANIEASYLGLPHELNVRADVLPEVLLGQYADATHEIILNVDLLTTATAHQALEVVTHEAYHAYERRLIDLYENSSEEDRALLVFDDARNYQAEFTHYISGIDDPEGYAAQSVEIDSQVYACWAVEDYYEKIEAYLSAGE